MIESLWKCSFTGDLKENNVMAVLMITGNGQAQSPKASRDLALLEIYISD